MTARNQPSAAFCATVVLVVTLVGHSLTFGA